MSFRDFTFKDISTGEKLYFSRPEERQRRLRALEASLVNASSSSAGSAGFIAAVSVGTGDPASTRPASDVANVISLAFSSDRAASVLAEAAIRLRNKHAAASSTNSIVYSLRNIEVRLLTITLENLRSLFHYNWVFVATYCMYAIC